MKKEKRAEENMTKEEHTAVKRVKENKTSTLYVKWAVKHLALIEECQAKLSNENNTNLLDLLVVMDAERQNLINHNPNYKEAQEILNSIRDTNFFTNKEDWGGKRS